MIKKIQIKNYKGIKDLTTLDFELNHLKHSQIENETTFIAKDGIKVMAVPTLISKNASGKTSVLDAIKFADSINSLDDLISWVTREAKEFESNIERTFKNNLPIVERWFSNEIPLEDVRQVMARTLSRVSHQLNLGEVYEEHLPKEELSREYMERGVGLFEEKIADNIQKITDHIYNSMFDFKSKKPKEMFIKIEYSKGDSKTISIGENIIFNNDSKSINSILKEIILNYEDSYYISNSFAKFNEFYLYSIDWHCCDYESLKEGNGTYGLEINRHSLKNAGSKVIKKVKLINDDIIRKQISNNNSKKDWGGEVLINTFVGYYGEKISSNIIKTIDKSISHIVGDKDSGLWSLKDNEGITRPVSNLSFGTFKTIFILNKIYLSWKEGRVLLIDEIENGLNISLIDLIVKFATNEKFAKDGFQVILTTHNPLLFTQNIINPQNAFVNIDGTFERVFDNKKIIKRSEDLDKVFASKNYFNEYYWLKAFGEPDKHSQTISRDDIFELLDEVEESFH